MAAMEKLFVHLFVALPPSPTLPKSPAFSFIIDNHNGKCWQRQHQIYWAPSKVWIRLKNSPCFGNGSPYLVKRAKYSWQSRFTYMLRMHVAGLENPNWGNAQMEHNQSVPILQLEFCGRKLLPFQTYLKSSQGLNYKLTWRLDNEDNGALAFAQYFLW